MRLAAAWILGALSVSGARAVELKPETVQAFDRYIRETEARLQQRLSPDAKFLWAD
jgi:anti-sigma-K factor RskA